MDALRVSDRPAGRLGGERLRTLLVLPVTAIVVAIVAVLVNQPAGGNGLTSITLTGDTSGAAPVAGAVPPDFTATTVDGTTVSLSSLRGQPVWLTFGASWCSDCRSEAPDLQATYAKFKDRGLVVLGVFIDEDAAAVSDYAGRVGFTFPMVADPSTRIASRYHTLGIPTHFFIGRDGVIREVRLGGLQPAEMERLVTGLLE